MSWNIHRLVAAVEFPVGAAPGSGRDGNAASLARNGRGEAVLRGSALAGVLRNAWVRRFGKTQKDAAHWFGSATDEHTGRPSRIIVHDALLGSGSETRTHNLIDRHTGAAIDGGLFTVESIAPGTRSAVVLVLRAAQEERDDAHELMRELLGLLQAGILTGGSSARGIGLLQLCTQPNHAASYRCFDLSKLDDHAVWLDEQHERQTLLARNSFTGTQPEPILPHTELTIAIQLRIPRGQDVVIGGDSGLDASIEPQVVVDAKGVKQLRFPGSAFRGVMRKWITRLAAREGLAVADSHSRALERRSNGKSIDGAALGWGFANEADRAAAQRDPSLIGCPVMALFGSLYAKGRLHIADALVPHNIARIQRRTHVSIDRFAGGANDSFLFNTDVVVSDSNAAFVLDLQLRVNDPSDQEAKWIAQTLRAIHLGVLRVGSSKASGRFELASATARGPHHQHFTNLVDQGVTTHG